MAEHQLVKNRFDFIVACRSLKQMRWMQAKVLTLKREWKREWKRQR